MSDNMVDAALITRIKQFLKENPQYREYISGVSTDPDEENKLQIKNKQGKIAKISIDDLENNRLDLNEFDKEEPIYNYKTLSNGEKVRIVEVPKSLKQIQEEEIEVMEDDFAPVPEIAQKSKKTLKDLEVAVVSKNINEINALLNDKYKNPNTGLTDIELAMKTIMDNCVIQAADCLKSNTKFESELSNYDLEGKAIGKQEKINGVVDKNEVLQNSFRPVLLIIAAASLKGNMTYSSDDKKRELANQFQIRVEDRLRTITPITTNKSNNQFVPEQDDKKIEEEKNLGLVLSPLKKQAAGFADIFILTIIILVYAAIIINLILKMR